MGPAIVSQVHLEVRIRQDVRNTNVCVSCLAEEHKQLLETSAIYHNRYNAGVRLCH
jgi:hypothetical protein